MNQPLQIVGDCWEANTDYNPDVLIANGVVGMIVRLNDMNGGHHMDELFAVNWAKAKRFPVQSIYFVYNPWKSGLENFLWLIEHLPSDFNGRRLFVDIEVRYPGYSAATYASETKAFMMLVWTKFPASRYSGGGFLDILNPWPTNEDYWWASYSGLLKTTLTWAQFYDILSKLSWDAYKKFCPGTCRMIQISGDGTTIPGIGKHAMDFNVFQGTLADLAKWFNCSITETPAEPELPEEEDVTTANPYPLGLFTRNAGWSKVNPNFDFVIGAAQSAGTVEPNPEIKPIQVETVGMNIPFMLLWDHFPWAYSEQQWGEPNWPTLDADYIYQNFVAILGARTYSAVVIRVETFAKKSGVREDPAFISFSAHQFVKRVEAWLKTNRPMVPLIVASSNQFIKTYAPNMNNWVGQYANMATDKAAKTESSYPAALLSPGYLGASNECAWWMYWTASLGQLVVFRGENGYPRTINGMRKWLNLPTIQDGGEEDDPVTPEPDSSLEDDFLMASANLASSEKTHAQIMQKYLDALSAYLKSLK